MHPLKGVSFHVADVKKTVVRRKVLHEYPQRDIPFIEDMGKGATKYSVTAFLVGDDCVTKAKNWRKSYFLPVQGLLCIRGKGILQSAFLMRALFITTMEPFDTAIFKLPLLKPVN